MKKHTFKKGERYLSPGEPFQLWQPGKVGELNYRVRFDETIRYTLPGEEQWDWLKGGGVSFDLFTNHKNSTMWGFRYNPDVDKVELNAYAHINKLRTFTKWLVDVSPGEEFTVRIYRGSASTWVTHLITAGKEVKHTWIIPSNSFVYRRIPAYFGGTLPAPQDVNMYLDFLKS